MFDSIIDSIESINAWLYINQFIKLKFTTFLFCLFRNLKLNLFKRRLAAAAFFGFCNQLTNWKLAKSPEGCFSSKLNFTMNIEDGSKDNYFKFDGYFYNLLLAIINKLLF